MAKSIWPSNDKTETLLVAAKGGDSDAVNRLLERHRASLRQFVEMRLDRKVRRRVDVSDVVQDVMIEANHRLQKYLGDPVMAFHLWMRQIARDRVIDTYRRHRVSAKRSMDKEQAMFVPAGSEQSSMDLAVQLCDPAMTPAAAATQRELAQQVEGVIAKLEDQDREIIIMRHYEHLTNLEISQVLQMNPPATSMRYLRAVRRLRELMEQEQVDSPYE